MVEKPHKKGFEDHNFVEIVKKQLDLQRPQHPELIPDGRQSVEDPIADPRRCGPVYV